MLSLPCPGGDQLVPCTVCSSEWVCKHAIPSCISRCLWAGMQSRALAMQSPCGFVLRADREAEIHSPALFRDHDSHLAQAADGLQRLAWDSWQPPMHKSVLDRWMARSMSWARAEDELSMTTVTCNLAASQRQWAHTARRPGRLHANGCPLQANAVSIDRQFLWSWREGGGGGGHARAADGFLEPDRLGMASCRRLGFGCCWASTNSIIGHMGNNSRRMSETLETFQHAVMQT